MRRLLTVIRRRRAAVRFSGPDMAAQAVAWLNGATVDLCIRVEEVDGEAVWWATSPQVPGFSAAAATLAELRERVWSAFFVEHILTQGSATTTTASTITAGPLHLR